MGRNKKENFIFTLICCFLMVLGMSVYHGILSNTLVSGGLSGFLPGFILVFAGALVLDWWVIGPLAKGLAARITPPDAPMIRKVLTISVLMVCGMCLCITLTISLIFSDSVSGFPGRLAHNLGMNFPAALVLQLLVAGPVSRTLFFRLYPPIQA